MIYALRGVMLVFLLVLPKVGVAVPLQSRLMFEFEHLKLDLPMWIGIEIEIPQDSILTYSELKSNFANPIVSADARKYFSVVGPFYPMPEKTSWAENDSVLGFQKKLILLFRVENQPEFHKRGWGSTLDLTYEIEVTLCSRKNTSCFPVKVKGRGQRVIATAKPDMTDFGRRMHNILPLYAQASAL